MSKNTVRVYDTITKKYVEVEVNETVRTYYDRTQWNIEDNDKSFYTVSYTHLRAHETVRNLV